MRLDYSDQIFYEIMTYTLADQHGVLNVTNDSGELYYAGMQVKWLHKPAFAGQYSNEPIWTSGASGPRSRMCVLTFSEHFFATRDQDVCENVVLHEVAHALTPLHNGHGQTWREKCLEIGGDGKEFDGSFAFQDVRWVRVCECGSEAFRAKPRRTAPNCPRCGFPNCFFFTAGTDDYLWMGNVAELQKLDRPSILRLESELAFAGSGGSI